MFDLQHLRRFAKPKYLPEHVLGQRDRVKEMYAVPRAWESSPVSVMQTDTEVWEWSSALKTRTAAKALTLYLLICPSELISLPDLYRLLLDHPPFTSSADSWAYPLEIKELTVPRLAPTSAEQAAAWSEQYWPTFYRKTNPFGAHPTTIAKAEDELHDPPNPQNISVAQAMELAEQVGAATEAKGYGIPTGCVIVERVDDHTEIIAVAGDARRRPLPSEGGVTALESALTSLDVDLNNDIATTLSKAKKKRERKKKNKAVKRAESRGCASGNVMAHAVMRALGMVGRKRLRCASQPLQASAAKAESNFAAAGLEHDERARDAFFLDLPLTTLEQQHFAADNLKPDGYLCLKLEVFLTHEPCMMCSMALVHSRVGRVIFKHRMPRTGGLTAETVRNDSGPPGLGYGLCWRKELNWQFVCWEYTARVNVEEERRKKMALQQHQHQHPQQQQQQQQQQNGTGENAREAGGVEDGNDDDDDYDYDDADEAFRDDYGNHANFSGNTSFASVHS